MIFKLPVRHFSLSALFLCATASWCLPAYGSETALDGDTPETSRQALLPENSLKLTREHWLRSKMKFSGRTNRDTDHRDGALNVGLNGLFWANHRAGVRYSDAKTYRVGNERRVLGFSYGLPVGRNHLDIELRNTAYEEVSRADGSRFQKEGRTRDLTITGRRALFSTFGYQFLGRAGYSSVNQYWTRRTDEVHRSSYQLSTVGFEANGHHNLYGGFDLSSGLRAVTGIEAEIERATDSEQGRREEQFGRMVLSASLDRELLAWQWGLDGEYQLASADIPGSQHLRVAGSGLVAGFNGQSLSVAEGGWLRLGSRSPEFDVPFFPRFSSSVRLSVLRGWIPDESFQQHQAGHVTSGEVSWGLSARQFSADVSLGRVLNTTTDAITVPDQPDVRFTMSLQI